jgi:hypothetical protein
MLPFCAAIMAGVLFSTFTSGFAPAQEEVRTKSKRRKKCGARKKSMSIRCSHDVKQYQMMKSVDLVTKYPGGSEKAEKHSQRRKDIFDVRILRLISGQYSMKICARFSGRVNCTRGKETEKLRTNRVAGAK